MTGKRDATGKAVMSLRCLFLDACCTASQFNCADSTLLIRGTEDLFRFIPSCTLLI